MGKELNIYTVDEAAIKLKVSSRLVYDLIKSKALEASNVGTSYRLTDWQLEKYLLSTQGVILPSTRGGRPAATQLDLPDEGAEPEQAIGADHSEGEPKQPKKRKRTPKKATPQLTGGASDGVEAAPIAGEIEAAPIEAIQPEMVPIEATQTETADDSISANPEQPDEV